MVMNGSDALSRAPSRLACRRLALLAFAVPAAILIANGMAHASEAIDVRLDRAKVMRIARPAATVILGNPAIADATIQDRLTLIITGRSFGTTNLIVLDQAGEPIADQLITVSSPNDDVVTVYSGDTRRSFSCSPDCQPTLSMGDSPQTFDIVKGQFQSRSDIVQNATSGGQPAAAN
ncbi:pilus assembly protein [Kaistia algarum]|uniref:pilus assembly protein N-terminal domain-containing protein n=1 Tax=Kaistia algarum TaxID=2083279 RepID=UPI000CE88BCF|nr:pilus assembly protein N-terminal domain-containing protein [Kaistia algarum]MCX5516658.1 pilus assembly protein N-terminal domain-containing protein [Kaistia algarum]PPE78561.1 pilus assembly protein [Kaistia algarum]